MTKKTRRTKRCEWVVGVVGEYASAINRCPQKAVYKVTVDGVVVGRVCAYHSADALWNDWGPLARI